MLPKNWIITALLLFVGLAGVILMKSKLGGGASQPEPVLAPGSKVNWCGDNPIEIRLGALSWRKKDGVWIAGSSGREVPELMTWMSQNCEITLGATRPVGSILTPFVRVIGASGDESGIEMDPEGSFAWRGTLFRSDALNSALQALRTMPP